MLEIAIYLVVLIVLIFALVKLIDKFVTPGNKKIFTAVLWGISLFLVYLIYSSIMKPIEFQNEKEARYEVAVKTMLDIKKLQTGYKSVNGKYADTFEELIKFVESGQFEIISRKDTAVIDAAKNAAFGITVGADGVGGFFKDEVIITKLGSVSVKDSLFKNSDRYKRLNVVKVGGVEVPVVMKTGVVSRNDMNLSVFQAIIDKNALLKDLDQELVKQENKVESIDEINGPQIILGSLEEVTLTGNWPKNMVITNNDITQKTYKKLSIQVSLSGLSFCVFDLISNKVINTMSIPFEKNKVIEEQLWRTFVDYPILTKSYDEVMVVHDNNLNAFVPTSLFDANFLASYLQYNTKVFETDFFTYDVVFPYEMNNIYVPFVNINNFLLDQYETFEYQNANSILVKQLLDLSKNKEEKQVFVHVQKEHFELIVVKNQQLILFNSFQYKTPEDFIYYILFTCEQLQLNPETILVQILGNCSEDDACFKIAFQYIRNCSLLDVTSKASILEVTPTALRNHFILYHS